METPTDSIQTDDVIIEILSRLPVKILCKCRCVSKSWNYLISTKYFCKTHLRNSNRYSDLTQTRIMLNFQRNLMHSSLYSLLYDTTIDPVETDYVVQFPGNTVWVVGSLDGLMCLAVSTGLVVETKDLYLWNPFTRKYNKLPDFGEEITYRTFFAYGLGFDKSADDYNVVGFCNSSHFRNPSPEGVVKVYSIKTGEWKRIKNYKGSGLIDNSAVFANGKFHWISYFDYSWKIEHLDVETEEYGILKMPKVEENGLSSNLGASDGCIYFLCFYETRADVWIMEGYDFGNETWSKVVSFPWMNEEFGMYNYNRLLYVKHGNVLFLYGSIFMIFDMKLGSFTYPVIRSSETILLARGYVESLVSPFGW